MRKHLISLFLLLILVLGMLPVSNALWEPDFPIEAASVYLLDLTTGEEIIARNIYERRSPASLTKMMTTLLVLESEPDLREEVTVPQRLADELALIERENGMSINIEPGERFTVEQLLHLTMLPSCNDAASVLADSVTGDLDLFISRMNDRARELGCTETEFNCVHGLFEEIGTGNWSSAADMALIARECIKCPELMELATTTEYWLPLSETRTVPHWTTLQTENAPAGMYRLIQSTNPIQKPDSPLYRSYDRGIKTGYTTWAGKCFVTTFQQDDQQFLLVLMGVPNENGPQGNPLIFEQAVQLGDWVTQNFAATPLVEEGEEAAFTEVRYSPDGDTLTLTSSGQLTALVGHGDTITREIQKPDRVDAPITAGTVMGSVTYYRNGESIGTVDLVAAGDMRYSTLEYVKTTIRELIDKLLGKGF